MTNMDWNAVADDCEMRANFFRRQADYVSRQNASDSPAHLLMKIGELVFENAASTIRVGIKAAQPQEDDG
ncbi:MAG: hypothetical protein C0605_07880 [Hyphomicrobiales bacterium]|nr:MAG: hypothetical protein C0605_07880 [Hyphomicrobiales bacterium]